MARAVALVLAGTVLTTAIVGGVFVLEEGAGRVDTEVDTVPTALPAAPARRPPAVVEDQLQGITLPLPDGWSGPGPDTGPGVLMTTTGGYDCPGDPGTCRHGLVVATPARPARTATTSGRAPSTSPRTAAEHDIPAAADAAYGHDPAGRRPFGGITSHRLVRAGRIAVAGRAGYLVRWRVGTARGPGGYVQSLAFPAAAGKAPAVLRLSLDAGADGPPRADLDRITRGIRALPAGERDPG